MTLVRLMRRPVFATSSGRWVLPAVLGAAALAAAAACTRPAADESMVVMTFNVRLDALSDGPNRWPYRKEMVAGTVLFHEADAVGCQEVLAHQLRDLAGLLPGYDRIAAGRDDGREAGEACPIFFRAERLSVRRSGTFWLSETPGSPGLKGWDAACPRIVTWADFQDRRTGGRLVMFNTHFDHVGETARRESARLLLRRAADIAAGLPLVVTGDFNCTETEPPFRILVEGDGGAPGLAEARLACATPPYGSVTTFNGFRPGDDGRGGRIDHILIRGIDSVLRYGVVSDRWDGRFASDHYPVVAEIVIRPSAR